MSPTEKSYLAGMLTAVEHVESMVRLGTVEQSHGLVLAASALRRNYTELLKTLTVDPQPTKAEVLEFATAAALRGLN